MKYQIVKGDLIKFALKGYFDVITHGCNCFCTMGSGIAVPMAKTFDCNLFPLEERTRIEYFPADKYSDEYEEYEEDTGNYGNIEKLGQIDYEETWVDLRNGIVGRSYSLPKPDYIHRFFVVNSYTQYSPGSPLPGEFIPLDYCALTLCMKKINRTFKGKHIGLPKIGAGLALGDWNKIEDIIKTELRDCDVTVIEYDK